MKKGKKKLRFLDSHAKFSTISRVAVVVDTFSDEILDDFHAFFGMCLFSKENQQPILEVTVFPMNGDNVHWT